MADGWEEIGPGVLVAYRRGKVPQEATRLEVLVDSGYSESPPDA